MADDNNVSFILNLDNANFLNSAKEAMDSINAIGDSSENLSSLVSTLGDVGMALGAAGIAAYAFKGALDLTLEGEQIQRTEQNFQNLATQANISADELKEGLERAANGMIPLNDLLMTANKSLIAMGASSAQLPAVLVLAQKAAMVTGESVQTVFNGMVESIEHANTRMLKHYGIVIDQSAAYQKMADSLGITKEELSEAGKQQAILNAAIEQGNKSLAGVDVNMNTATSTLQQLSAAFKEIKETAALAFEAIGGEKVRSALSFVRDWASEANTYFVDKYGKGAAQAAAHTKRITERIDELKLALVDLEQKQLHFDPAPADTIARIHAAKTELTALQSQMAASDKINQQNAKSSQTASQEEIAANNEVLKNRLINNEQKKKDDEKFNAEMLKIHQQTVQDQVKQQQEILKGEEAANKEEMKNVQSLAQIETEIKRQDTLRAQESQQNLDKINQEFANREIQRQQEISKAKQQYSADDPRRAAEMNAINTRYANDDANKTKQVALEKQRYSQQELQAQKTDEKTREQLLENYQKNADNVFSGVARSAQKMSQKAKADMADFGAQGQFIMGEFQKSSTSAFDQIGQGIAANQNLAKTAATAMKTAFLGMIGDIAQHYGEMLLLESVVPPNPAGLAAGAALITLGGYLHGLAGASSSSSGVSVGSGGGSGAAASSGPGTQTATSPSAASSTDQTQALSQQQTVQRTVSINIAGNYLNTQESQRTIMELMRNETDATGFSYNKIGV